MRTVYAFLRYDFHRSGTGSPRYAIDFNYNYRRRRAAADPIIIVHGILERARAFILYTCNWTLWEMNVVPHATRIGRLRSVTIGSIRFAVAANPLPSLQRSTGRYLNEWEGEGGRRSVRIRRENSQYLCEIFLNTYVGVFRKKSQSLNLFGCQTKINLWE